MSTQFPTIGYPVAVSAPSPQALGAVLDRVAYASLCAFIFAIPLEETVPLFGGLAVSRWFGMLAFGLGLFRFAAWSQTRRFRELHVWMFAFALWSSASILWTLDPDSTAIRAFTYLQLLLLGWLIWLLVDTERRVQGLLQSYVLGTGVCAVVTVSNLLTGHGYSALPDADGQVVVRSDRYSANGLNPNDLGLMLALSIPMIVYLLARPKQNPAIALFRWAQFALCVAAVLLTGSRGGLLATFAALVALPLTYGRLPRWQKVIAILVCLGAVVCGVLLVPPDTWQRFLQLGNEISEGTMTHRTQIWVASVELFRSHAFLGVGSSAHPAAVVGIIGRPMVAHNTFLSVLVELGIPGELLLVGLLGAAFFCAWRMKGLERVLWVVSLITWCVGVCSATWEYRKTTWLLIGLMVSHAYVRTRRFHRPSVRREIF
jgi:O-antigen ligase